MEAARHMGEGDWIRLSLDSGSNELFVAMHKPVNKKWDLDAVCEWVPRIKEANPVVRRGFSYIIVWGGASRDGERIHENIDEIVMAAERAKKYQFDYIAYKPVLERRDDGAEVMDPETVQAELDQVLRRIRSAVDEAKPAPPTVASPRRRSRSAMGGRTSSRRRPPGVGSPRSWTASTPATSAARSPASTTASTGGSRS